jgi:membrane associated rhomboid family serine protease
MDFSRHFTIAAIIVVAGLVFALEQAQQTSFAETYGAVPVAVAGAWRQLMSGDVSLPVLKTLATLISYQFLHGDAQHITFNMVFLWAFGILTAEIIGQWWALACFLVCGVCGGILQVYLTATSDAPMIGASGSICGLGGVYLGLALRWRLPPAFVWPLAYPIPPLQLGAIAVVVFIVDLFRLANQSQTIAYGTHLGGCLSGLLIAAVLTTIYPNLEDFRRRRKWHTSPKR